MNDPPERSGEEVSTTSTSIRMSEHSGVEIPSDAEVFAYAAAWPGEPASAAPPMPAEWVAGWLKQMNGRVVGWPLDWRRSLRATWRVEFRVWMGLSGKNGRGALVELRKKWGEHPANPESMYYRPDCPAALVLEGEKMKRELGG